MNYNKIELSILNQKKENIEKVLKSKNIKNIHIDIMDGYFVKNLSNITPFFLKNLNLEKYNLHLHLHFMVEDVETYFSYYDFLENIGYISFHFESNFYKNGKILDFINKLKQKNIKIGLAINPNTEINSLLTEDFSPLQIFDFVLLMTVVPGKGGQKFIKSSKEKIINLRKIFNKEIIIDGGVNEEIYKKLENTVNKFVMGSFLFNKDI